MDLNDLDIYEDLDTFQKEEEKKTAELLSLEAKYNDSQKTIETLQVENAELKKQIRRIGINFQNLLDTAKAEIKRKDKQIDQIRKEKDDICFRRKQPRREYTDFGSSSQNTNSWFRDESVLPAHDFEANTNANAQRGKESVETMNNEQPCTTSYTKSLCEFVQMRDEYKKAELRDERSERKYDCDPQREKYNRANSQRDQHESRQRAHSKDSSARRDYSRSYDSRTADRSRRDERDIRHKNKLYTTEKEKESYNNTDNGRRQRSYDRLSDRSRHHSKEDSRYDRRSDRKEEKTKSESYDSRHDRRSDFKKYHEDTNKKSKEKNEKACEEVNNINKNEVATYAKNSDARKRHDDMRGKSSKPSESNRENKFNESHKLSKGSHTEAKRTETVEDLAFLGKNLPATKDPKNLEKVLAEEKLNKEKLLSAESDSTRTRTDTNANCLMPANGMTTPKKTAMLDKLFGSTPTNERDINSNTLSNAIGFLKSNNSSVTTSPSNYTDTSESTTIAYTNNRKNTESDEDYLPINGDQNNHNKNDIRVVVKNDNTATNSDLTVEAKSEELISSVTSKNQTADESTFTKFGNSVKTSEETLDFAKLATSMLSEEEEEEDETEVEQAVETVSTYNDAAIYNEQKTNGNKNKGGIQILQNIRLPNIYEIRAQQRRLLEAIAAKKAKRALTAKAKDIQKNANTTKMVPVPEDTSKDLEKTPTTATENNKGVGLQDGCVETKNKQDEECSLGNSPQLNVSVSADLNTITFNNEKTMEENGTETSNTAVQQSIGNVTLSDQNISSLLAAAAIIENAEKCVNSNTAADDAVLKQMKSDAICTNQQTESEVAISTNNIENSEEIPNAAEIMDIQLKQVDDHCQKETEETNSNEVNIDVNNTREIVAEETNSQNEAKNEQTSIEINIKSATSPTPDSRSEENQTEEVCTEVGKTYAKKDMPDGNLVTKVMSDDSERKDTSIESKENIPTLNSTTEGGQTFINKDMPDSNLLTKVLPDDSEQLKSIVESKENILKSQDPDESKDEDSQCSEKAENNTVIAAVAEESEKSCEQNVDTQGSSAKLQKMDEQKVVLTPEADSQACKKRIEPLKTANETMTKTQVVPENTESKCDMVLSEESTLEKHVVVSEQKTLEQTEVEITETKEVIESAVDKSEELLETAEASIAKTGVIENCIAESNDIVIPDSMTSSNTERSSECSTNVALSNDNNSIIIAKDLSAITENDTNTVAIEESVSRIHKVICAVTEIAGRNENELHESEVAVPYLINNKDTPIENCVEEKETIPAVQNVPKTEPTSVAESKEIKLHTKTPCMSKNIKSKPKELSKTINISAERNVIVENMKRAEVLWKFKIPKISAKRKREESVDSPSSKESKNTESEAVKREKLCNNAETPLNLHKKKKSTMLLSKQKSEEKKVLETLFEDQKKSERIIKEIDNWARRKVGEKAEILETEIQIETAQTHKKSSSQHETMSNMNGKAEIVTDLKVLNTHIKQKSDKQKAHRDTNTECSSNDSKCVPENRQECKKSPKKQTSPCNKGDKTHTKGQNTKIQERRKSHSKVEDVDHTHGSKHRDVKSTDETHKEKSRTNGGNNDKCEETVATKTQCGEVQTRKIGNGENGNNTVKKSPVSGELGEKSKKIFHTNIENENNNVKKEVEIRELEDKSKKSSNTENITTKSLVDGTISSKITKVKSECSKESADTSNQKKECDGNGFVSKRKSIEKDEAQTDNHEKRAKSDVDVGKNCIVQKVTVNEVSSTEITEVATAAHDMLGDVTIASGSNTATTKYNPATFAQTPKRRRTAGDTSSDDSEVMSKPRRRKHCKMCVEENDDDECVSFTVPTTMPHPSAVNHVDAERRNEDIIDILQNDRPNESNDNLPAPQTPTSLPANISHDAAYEEIDTRLQLMFASPKPADKTSTNSSLSVASQVKVQLLQPTLETSAVAIDVTDNDVPAEIGLPVTKAPVDDAKPPADFSVTDTFLSDISANSYLASDMNVTINETNHSGVNANSSFSDSNVSTKHISLGSSDYRFEKVSENVVNLFITRKRRGKRKSTATITTNTVSAT
uniref:CASP8-associated protein 2 n=1 Tax=Zeugodacus cucurbitae TaxID=28588 RepID=A0A0A1XBH8_ZEUCU